MCLVWEDDVEGISWWADYSDELSDYAFTDIISYNNENISGNVVLNINNGTVADVKRSDVGSFAGSARMVSFRLRRHLESVAGSQIGFFPAVCNCTDGKLIGYSLVAPKRHISCVDLARTEVIDWIIPGEVISIYRRIYLRDRSIEPMGICRDLNVPRFTIIGRELAESMINSGFSGLCFAEIESARNAFD